MKYLYYPGCAQKSSSRSYERSLLAVCEVLGIKLHEIEDWNCCGTTISISVSKMVSSYFAARNLGLANHHKLPVVTPCPSCYISLKRVLKESQENKNQFYKINELLAQEDLFFSTDTEVFHVLEFLVNVIGLDCIGEKVRRPLTGFRIAPYYGCQLISPYANRGKYDLQDIEKLIETMGGYPVDFPFRTNCCGGSLMFTLKGQAEKLSSMIIHSILKTDANLIVTPCGLCQLNLEIARKRICREISDHRFLPILNLGQLLGLAFDIDTRTLSVNRKKYVAKQGSFQIITSQMKS